MAVFFAAGFDLTGAAAAALGVAFFAAFFALRTATLPPVVRGLAVFFAAFAERCFAAMSVLNIPYLDR